MTDGYEVHVLDRTASLQILQAISEQDGIARGATLARALGYSLECALLLLVGGEALERHLVLEGWLK